MSNKVIVNVSQSPILKDSETGKLYPEYSFFGDGNPRSPYFSRVKGKMAWFVEFDDASSGESRQDLGFLGPFVSKDDARNKGEAFVLSKGLKSVSHEESDFARQGDPASYAKGGLNKEGKSMSKKIVETDTKEDNYYTQRQKSGAKQGPLPKPGSNPDRPYPNKMTGRHEPIGQQIKRYLKIDRGIQSIEDLTPSELVHLIERLPKDSNDDADIYLRRMAVAQAQKFAEILGNIKEGKSMSKNHSKVLKAVVEGKLANVDLPTSSVDHRRLTVDEIKKYIVEEFGKAKEANEEEPEEGSWGDAEIAKEVDWIKSLDIKEYFQPKKKK